MKKAAMKTKKGGKMAVMAGKAPMAKSPKKSVGKKK